MRHPDAVSSIFYIVTPPTLLSRLQGWIRNFADLKGSIGLILFWPAICALLIFVLLRMSDARVAEDQKQLRENAYKDVASLSRAYAQYLTRAIEQIDQVSMHVKYDWEKTDGHLQLEDLRRSGLFTARFFDTVSILRADGEAASSITSDKSWNKHAHQLLNDAFHFHQNNNSSALRISLPAAGSTDMHQKILFTRRLDSADDSFGGIVVILVDASYFSDFYDEQMLNKMGLLATMTFDEQIGIVRIGEHATTPDGAPLIQQLSLSGSAGTGYFSGKEHFTDHLGRFVGWQSLSAYPIVAITGLSEQELRDSHQQVWQANAANTRLIVHLLIGFAVIAAVLSARLAWRKQQAKMVRDTYRLATEATEDGFYMVNAIYDTAQHIVDFEYVDCNSRGASFFGLNRNELIGARLSTLQETDYFNILMEIYSKAMASGYYEDEYEIPEKSPLNMHWARRRLARSGTGLAVTIQDISSRKENEENLQRLANQDGLTGLYNRHWLLNFLPQAIRRAQINQHMLALLFIDLDGFKNVNDTQGHAAGDDLLKLVASRLQSVLRPTDNVVRLGGDEFVVLLEPVQRESKPARVSERITDAFKQPFWWNGEKHHVGASIGISLYPRDGEDTETLLKNADIAMYSVKASGKGSYSFFKPELFAKVKARFELEQAMMQALESDQFILYYQPRVNTFTGEFTSMEALVRWQHPERGMISPAEFIPLAESTGLILPIGEIVMRKACTQIAAWRSQGLPLIPVSINVSARQFHAGKLEAKLRSYLEQYALPATLLEMEITESSMMGEDNAILAELASIRGLGIKLLVDDFGTGYSSLSQLQRLEMDILKIDRVFTNALGRSREGEVFFHAIVSMAHALNMSVVAEGVETEQQLDVLRRLQCDEIQGFFVSRPVPAEQIPALMCQRYLLPATPNEVV